MVAIRWRWWFDEVVMGDGQGSSVDYRDEELELERWVLTVMMAACCLLDDCGEGIDRCGMGVWRGRSRVCVLCHPFARREPGLIRLGAGRAP